MLSSPRKKSHRVRQQSLRQEYEEFILQRIEEYKEQISRHELMLIADEAVRELEIGSEEQLVLTEVLVLEHVDRLIMRRLRLPTFRRWRDKHLKRRQSQREPTHWGLDPGTPLAELALRLDDTDVALLVGSGVASVGLFLAANDWPVILIDKDLGSIEAVETRVAAEGLVSRFQAMVVNLGNWFPDLRPTLTVLDVATLGSLEPATLERVIYTFKELTTQGGVHCIVSGRAHHAARHHTRDVLMNHYGDWGVQAQTGGNSSDGFLAVKPLQTA
jgi:hypothetical protein